MSQLLTGTVLSVLLLTTLPQGEVGDPVVQESSPAPSITATPTSPSYQKIAVHYGIDANLDGRVGKDEHVAPPKGAQAILTSADEEASRPLARSGSELAGEVDPAAFSSLSLNTPEGYTLLSPRDSITDLSPYASKGGYVVDVALKPILGMSATASHKADGSTYTVTYKVRNTGQHEIKVSSSLGACKKMKLAAGKQKTCSVSSSYYLKDKPLRIPNRFTAFYRGHEFSSENVTEAITERSPGLSSDDGAPRRDTSWNIMHPRPGKTPIAAKQPRGGDQAQPAQHKPSWGWWALGAGVVAVLIACIIGFVIARKKRKAKEEEDKNPPSGPGPLADGDVPEGENYPPSGAIPLGEQSGDESTPVVWDESLGGEDTGSRPVVKPQDSGVLNSKPLFTIVDDWSQDKHEEYRRNRENL